MRDEATKPQAYANLHVSRYEYEYQQQRSALYKERMESHSNFIYELLNERPREWLFGVGVGILIGAWLTFSALYDF